MRIPTTASFTINQNGDFITVPIEIENDGEQSIDVYAHKFIDENRTVGINVKSKTEIVNRSEIALNIFGNYGIAYFKTEDINTEKTGIYKEPELINPSKADGIKLSTIGPTSSGTLTLKGEAGKDLGIDTAIRDRFTLILKIKRSTN